MHNSVKKEGRILFLTKDTELLRKQVAGEELQQVPKLTELMDNISTDDMTPVFACKKTWTFDIGNYFLTGLNDLRGRVFPEGSLMNLGIQVIVAGENYGMGSSREVAALAQKALGLKQALQVVVFARSFSPIHRDNLNNNGVLTSTNFSLLKELLAGSDVAFSEFTNSMDELSASILMYGGLVPYNLARLNGTVKLPGQKASQQPMNITEKIYARHMIDPNTARVGLENVKPGDFGFARVDMGWFHEFTAGQLGWMLEQYGQENVKFDSSTWFATRDHTNYAAALVKMGLKPQEDADDAENLAKAQREFCSKFKIRLFDSPPYVDDHSPGPEGISHDLAIRFSKPGGFYIATDSHTCNVGATNTIAFGLGTSDIAGAMATGSVRVVVPESVRYNLTGKLNQVPMENGWVTTKDLMHHILSRKDLVEPARNRVMEWGGEALSDISMDQRSTMTNMATECAAKTATFEADEVTIDYIKKNHPELAGEHMRSMFVVPDAGARYSQEFTINLSDIRPMVARPGNPKNGVLTSVLEEVKINHATVGSCTSAKEEDMDLVAMVIMEAKETGVDSLPDGVTLYIYTASKYVENYARSKGYWDLFGSVRGVRLMPSGCGACIDSGPGITRPDEVAISNFNRNFAGRNGLGQMYLGSTPTVVASALTGKITAYKPGMFAEQKVKQHAV